MRLTARGGRRRRRRGRFWGDVPGQHTITRHNPRFERLLTPMRRPWRWRGRAGEGTYRFLYSADIGV
jgi:hypothetical protein